MIADIGGGTSEWPLSLWGRCYCKSIRVGGDDGLAIIQHIKKKYNLMIDRTADDVKIGIGTPITGKTIRRWRYGVGLVSGCLKPEYRLEDCGGLADQWVIIDAIRVTLKDPRAGCRYHG